MTNDSTAMTKIGVILSGSGTSECAFQPLEEFEAKVMEGKLVVVGSRKDNTQILGRIGSIVPYNVFYSEGDAFSEARRKGMPIPEDIARQYSVCKVDLLQKLTVSPSKAVTFPPHPGDAVFAYDPATHEKKLFGVARGDGDDRTIWFGTQVGYPDAPIALNVENMPMHAAIFGVTGSGKSYNMGSFLECLSEIPFAVGENARSYLSYPLIIIDANGDYSDYAKENEDKEIGSFGVRAIKRVFFPCSYDREQSMGTAGPSLQKLAINLNVLTSRDLAEMIMEFYRGSQEAVSELQVSAIQRKMDQLEEAMGFTKHDLLTTQFQSLYDLVDTAGSNDIPHQTKPAVLRALNVFRRRMDEDNRLLSDTECPWFEIQQMIESLTRGGVAILDFSADGATGIDLPIKQFVIGYLSAVLFQEFTRYKQSRDGTRYLAFVIEEAQNFCPGRRYPIGTSLAKTKLSAIATQGRKFGLSLCLISQRPSFVDEIVLSMCNTFFIHRISPEDVSFVKGVTGGLPGSLSSRLTTLSKGECIVTGQMNRVPFAMLVKGVFPRRLVPTHTAGTTDVVRRIAQIRGG